MFWLDFHQWPRKYVRSSVIYKRGQPGARRPQTFHNRYHSRGPSQVGLGGEKEASDRRSLSI